MKHLVVLFSLAAFLFIGCEKDDAAVTPTPTSSNVFTSSNITKSPVYFSFAKGDSVASTSAWDIKLTTLFAPDDSLHGFPWGGIVLNSAANVTGTYLDGVTYESIDQTKTTGLKKDILDTVKVDSTRSIKSMPLYYSFVQRETTTVDGNWDVKLTINAAGEPLIMLNKSKGVTAKVLDNTDYATLNTVTVTGLESDVNDTTLAIGNKCFLYAGPPTHKLNPVVNRTFLIRAANGTRIKVKMLNYYRVNELGVATSGFFKFEYTAPESYSLGTSVLKYSGPPTHKLVPYANRTFVLQTSAGKRAKFKILTYQNDATVSGFMKIQYDIK